MKVQVGVPDLRVDDRQRMGRPDRAGRTAAVLAAAVWVLAAAPAQAATLPNGRALQPDGTLVGLGNFPTGGALTPDGRFYWTVSSGFARNEVQIVSVADARVVSTVQLPGASGGIVMDPRRPVAYVSGVADSDQPELQAPEAQGRGGDVIHVVTYDRVSGAAIPSGVIAVPPPAGTPPPQAFPPASAPLSWPDRLAISPNGHTLLVPLNLANAAAIVDLPSGSVRYVTTGRYPYGAAVLGDGKTGLVSNETAGTVSVIDLVGGSKLKDIQVGGPLSHPEAIALDPRAPRAYVALANSDEVAVIDTTTMTLAQTLSLARSEGFGASPNALSVSPDGSRLLVTEAGADDVAVFALPESPSARAPMPLVGRVPVAAYPTDVRATQSGKLVWIAAKGLGTGPLPDGPDPNNPNDPALFGIAANNQGLAVPFSYLPGIVDGVAGIADDPNAASLQTLTAQALASIQPTNATAAPADTPLRPGGPIKHVFFIVRENRTYDQVLGDVARGAGDPALTLFDQQVTPNMHALVARFPLLDHVFADSEASIDGHFWTSAAQVSDYVNKAWFQNYAGRGRPYDFGVYAVTWPGHRFLFDQARNQGISYFNFGEALAGTVPLPDLDRSATDNAEVASKLANSDLGAGGLGVGGAQATSCYPNDAFIGKDPTTGREVFDSSPPAGAPAQSESRFDCFAQDFSRWMTLGNAPTFVYMILNSDHTRGTDPGSPTPRAMVADNDRALGQVVDLISHSPIWSSSAIFTIEDDSQDGSDHVDAHRVPAGVFSPYARTGAVVSTRYDTLSMIRSMELIIGMRPLGLFDALATPMYDAFTSTPDPTPFTAQEPTYPLLERNPPAPSAAAAANFSRPDLVPQVLLDKMIWRSVKGAGSVPPPPGPNAAAGQ